MREVMLRRLHDDRGATAVIVTLCLVAIFAMLTLTVDVGGLLYKRRELVNGSDAAALAAAQSCAITSDSDNPEDVADQYAGDNVNGLAGSGIASQTNIIDEQGCDSLSTGHVTVQYSMPQRLYFAEVLGFGRTSPVLARSTAAWGPLAGGNAVPIVLDSGTVQGPCDVPDANIGDTCPFWFNNGSGSFGNGAWGYLNLDEWNVVVTANCSSSGSANRRQYIQNGYPSTLSLNGNPPGSLPTYVCVDSGHSASNWSDLQGQEGTIKLFPVNDCTGQVDRGGNVIGCGSATSADKYDIIGFVSLEIVRVSKGNTVTAIGAAGPTGTCATNNNNPKNWTSVGQTLDLDSISSATNGWAGCPATIPPASISNVILSKDRNRDPACCTLGVDYQYDPTTHVVTWIGSVPHKTKIQFDWSLPGNGGDCPGHSSDPNAICLLTRWQGFSVAPGPIGTGADLGSRAIRLCDLTISGSCPPGA